jgi:hypothetical protein
LSRAASENGYGDCTSQCRANECMFTCSHSSFRCCLCPQRRRQFVLAHPAVSFQGCRFGIFSSMGL